MLHMFRVRALASIVRQHRILSRHTRVAAFAVPPAQIAVAVALSVGAVGSLFGRSSFGRVDVLTLGIMGSSVAFVALAIYSEAVRRRTPGAPCGCLGSTRPISRWVVGRAAAVGLVAFASLAAILVSEPESALAGLGLRAVGIALLAAIAFSVILGVLPEAMHEPAYREAPE